MRSGGMCLKVSSQRQLCCLEVNIRLTQGRAAHTSHHCLFLSKVVEESTSLTPHQQKILSPSIDLNLSNCFFSFPRHEAVHFFQHSFCPHLHVYMKVYTAQRPLCVSQHPFLYVSFTRQENQHFPQQFHFYLRVCVGRYLSYSYAGGNKLPLSMCIEMSLSPPYLPLLTTVYQLSRTRRGSFFHISLLDHREGALSRRPPLNGEASLLTATLAIVREML